jgi:hypothetical protein
MVRNQQRLHLANENEDKSGGFAAKKWTIGCGKLESSSERFSPNGKIVSNLVIRMPELFPAANWRHPNSTMTSHNSRSRLKMQYRT